MIIIISFAYIVLLHIIRGIYNTNTWENPLSIHYSVLITFSKLVCYNYNLLPILITFKSFMETLITVLGIYTIVHNKYIYRFASDRHFPSSPCIQLTRDRLLFFFPHFSLIRVRISKVSLQEVPFYHSHHF